MDEIAVHEAGHTVAHYALGWDVESVTVVPGRDGVGEYLGIARVKPSDRVLDASNEERVIACLCGPLAVASLFCRPMVMDFDAAGSDGDEIKARIFAECGDTPDPFATRFYRWARAKAFSLVLENRERIRELAEHLETEKTMYGGAVQWVLGKRGREVLERVKAKRVAEVEQRKERGIAPKWHESMGVEVR